MTPILMKDPKNWAENIPTVKGNYAKKFAEKLNYENR